MKSLSYVTFCYREIQQNLSRLLCELGQEPQIVVNCHKGSEKLSQSSNRLRTKQYDYYENDASHNSHVYNTKPTSQGIEFQSISNFTGQFHSYGKKLSTGARSAVEKMKSLIK